MYAPIVTEGVVGNDMCHGKAIAACGNGMQWDLAMEVFNGAESHGVVRGAVSTVDSKHSKARRTNVNLRTRAFGTKFSELGLDRFCSDKRIKSAVFSLPYCVVGHPYDSVPPFALCAYRK